jgi:fumarate hydratase class II
VESPHQFWCRKTHLASQRSISGKPTCLPAGAGFSAYGVAVREAISDIRHAGDSLRELGLGGSAVGIGINTHPDYRVKAVANLAKISGLFFCVDMRRTIHVNTSATPAHDNRALRLRLGTLIKTAMVDEDILSLRMDATFPLSRRSYKREALNE